MRRQAAQRARELTQKSLPAGSAASPRGDGSSAVLLLGAAGAAALAVAYATQYTRKPAAEGETTLSNWSNTHEVSTARYHTPESLEELEALVAAAHESRSKLRPVGSGLSPNGLGFCATGMVNLALCDKVLHVDGARGRVTLQAGARLEVALRALREHGWTLQNFSSIKEQQVGGWTQAGCHGTGAGLPPVDETVVALKLVTPAKGTLLLDGNTNPELFKLAKVGLGALGVVAEVTLQGVRSHVLAERLQLMTVDEVVKGHAARLQRHRHVRYMWFPYCDAVAVVTADDLASCPPGTAPTPLRPEAERTVALRALLRSSGGEAAAAAADDAALSFADLRDRLLALNPLSAAHVAAVNAAEVEFWRASQGVRVGDSEAILGFECGGEQAVSEVAFPCGTRQAPSGADVAVAREALAYIAREGIPAPAPLEQRWSCGSSAPMSPAHSAAAPQQALHSWLGIIMYLPPANGPGAEPGRRRAVQSAFEAYRRGLHAAVLAPRGAAEHWAKVELPGSEAELVALRRALNARFPLERFNAARQELDPNNVLGNDLVDALLPRTRVFTSAAV